MHDGLDRPTGRRSEGDLPAKTSRPLEDMGPCLSRAFYAFRTLLERLLAESGLNEWFSPGMGPVFYALLEGDNCTMSEISLRTGLARCTLSGQIARMKRTGLIRTRRDAADGRAVRVILTPQARSLAPRLGRLHQQILEMLRGTMTPERFEEVRLGLVRMIEAMQECGRT